MDLDCECYEHLKTNARVLHLEGHWSLVCIKGKEAEGHGGGVPIFFEIDKHARGRGGGGVMCHLFDWRGAHVYTITFTIKDRSCLTLNNKCQIRCQLSTTFYLIYSILTICHPSLAKEGESAKPFKTLDHFIESRQGGCRLLRACTA